MFSVQVFSRIDRVFMCNKLVVTSTTVLGTPLISIAITRPSAPITRRITFSSVRESYNFSQIAAIYRTHSIVANIAYVDPMDRTCLACTSVSRGRFIVNKIRKEREARATPITQIRKREYSNGYTRPCVRRLHR